MKLFDLHCDTITLLEERGDSLFDNDLHVSLEGAAGYESYVQTFAIFIPDELRGQQAVDYFNKICDFYEGQMAENSHIISSYFDKKSSPMKAILAVEGGAAAAGSLEGLTHLYKRGVRLMTLTWNGQNEIASGCWAEPDSGLTDFGKEALAEMERLGMVADISHLSKKSFWDVAERAEKPFIASHSNCDIVRNESGRRRSLDDEQIRCLIERGGLMGINFCEDFLGDGGNSSFEAVYRHISYVLDLGGEKILSLGSDFDGCNILPELAGVGKMAGLYDFLLSKNMGEALCQNIFHDNADMFFKRLYTDSHIC